MRASSTAGGGRFVEARWAIGEDVTAVAPRDADAGIAPPPSRPTASEQAQRLRDAQETAGASTAAAERALKMAREAREVACATLHELGAQADALRGAAASLGEAEAAVDASERTLDDINAGCFGCLAPRRRLARRQLVPGGGGGSWRRWWSPGGGAGAAAERREAPAPAEASFPGGASQRLRKPASAKSAAARARLASSQPSRAVAGGAAGGCAQAGGSKGGGGGNGAFGDALLDKEASAQDAALSQLDAAVRRAAAAPSAPLADVAFVGAQVSELAVISSRIGEELDQQAPVLDALHQRADELGGRFRAMSTTGKMGRIKAAKTTAAGGADRKEAPPHGRTASR